MGDGYGRKGRGKGFGWDDRDGVWSGMHDDMGWGGWLLMTLLLLILVVLVVAVVLALAGTITTGLRPARAGVTGTATASPRGSTAAEQLLDERYARGELDEEEYRHRRSVLREG